MQGCFQAAFARARSESRNGMCGNESSVEGSRALPQTAERFLFSEVPSTLKTNRRMETGSVVERGAADPER